MIYDMICKEIIKEMKSRHTKSEQFPDKNSKRPAERTMCI